jgi:arabinan endo-1,5-alpha-L-arabinosidase
MVLGSYWNGIYITQLSTTTGKRITANSPTFRIADREPGIEAALMVERDGKFYLFVNWGTCCDGTSSTYNIRVGRSNSPTGPFVDKNGASMVSGAGTAFLATQGRYIGPGHAGIFVENGQEWFGYHFYDGLTQNGTATYDMRPLTWGADGWPVLGAYPAGDYTGDLQTSGADFLVWQRRLGSTNSAPDGNDDGRVTGADLTVWRSGFGAGQGGAAPAPEPAAAVLAACALGRLRQRRRPMR